MPPRPFLCHFWCNLVQAKCRSELIVYRPRSRIRKQLHIQALWKVMACLISSTNLVHCIVFTEYVGGSLYLGCLSFTFCCFGSFETVCHLLWHEGLMLELAECRNQATKKYCESGSVSKNFSVSLMKQRKFLFCVSCIMLSVGTIFLNCTNIRIPRLLTYVLK